MRVSIFRPSLFAFFILTLMIIGRSAFGISVKPAFLDLKVTPGKTHTGMVTVTNTSGSEERYRVAAAHFYLTREGRLEPAEPDSSSMAQWIKFNPKEFTLAPNARQQIRYTLIPAQDARTGDYWGLLEFTNLAARMATSDDTTAETNVKIAVSTAIVVPIFVQVGEVSYNWSILNLKAEMGEVRPQVLVTLSNTANGRVPFSTEIEILDASETVVAKQDRRELSLFPFSERVVTLPIEAELEPGDYTVRVRVISEKASSSKAGETSLKIP